MPQRSVLVLGGNGFIGRHAAAALINAGVHVIIGTRFAQRKHSWHALHPAVAKAPQREVRLEQLADADDWLPVIENVDAVLNCVGILRQRGRETYDAIHRQAPAALAAACKSQRKRFVHVSALGLEKPAKSRFLTSKLAGEKAIAEHGESWHFREYILALRRTYTKAPALCVPIPGLLARLGAHLCDVLHFTPFSFGHWELLRRDNIPVNNRLPELLGRAPVSVVSRNVRDQEITGVR